MNLLEQWERERREIETALAEGRMDPDAAAKALAHLEYRIKRRPRILKRRQDRNAWRKAQAAKLMTAREILLNTPGNQFPGN